MFWKNRKLKSKLSPYRWDTLYMHVRVHPFKRSANFYNFLVLLPSVGIIITIRWQIWRLEDTFYVRPIKYFQNQESNKNLKSVRVFISIKVEGKLFVDPWWPWNPKMKTMEYAKRCRKWVFVDFLLFSTFCLGVWPWWDDCGGKVCSICQPLWRKTI